MITNGKDICNINEEQVKVEQKVDDSMLNWVNEYFSISSLTDLTNISILVLFLNKLFNLKLTEQDDLLNQIVFNPSITLPTQFNFTTFLNGDQNQILILLGFIQTQYQYYSLHHILNNNQLSFTSYVHQFIPSSQFNDLKNNLILWANFILSDYISASFILPIQNLLSSSWNNGLHFLCILHYHLPSILPDLNVYLSKKKAALNKFLHVLNSHFPTTRNATTTLNILTSSTNDENVIIQFLLDFIPFLNSPNHDQTIQRIQHLTHFKSILHDNDQNQQLSASSSLSSTPSLCNSAEEDFSTSTTLTSTYTLQQLRITKTTITKYSDGTEIPVDLEEFESRASNLVEKMTNLQTRLESIVPTRSSYSPTASSADQNSTNMMDLYASSVDDNQSIRTFNSNPNQTEHDHPHQLVRVLHPLQAAEEDYSAYDRNLKQLQSEFQTLTDGDLQLFWEYLQNDVKPDYRDFPKVIWRQNQIQQIHLHLTQQLEQSENSLVKFRRGFAFARMCLSIRQALEGVQNKMVKSITTQHDVQDLESGMEKTSGMVMTLKDNFHDLLDDTAYRTKFEHIQHKNDLVRSWVEEVRVWFAEAERIKQWIEIRLDRLDQIVIPEPLSGQTSREEMETLNGVHGALEKEIEAFDGEDMARLRSHVKTLTGSGRADKDLSPADTTTIEITLTTLMTLDQLMHSLRKKKYDLQVLTRRVIWEEAYERSIQWLTETDLEIDRFIHQDARWLPSEADEHDLPDDPLQEQRLKRERLMQREKQKENVVQHLLSLERQMAEFDSGQFTATVDSFQDLDNTSSVELPKSLERRQDALEQQFEDLMKRMVFARHVVEQRLNMMDFIYQTELVVQDMVALQQDLAEAELYPGETDREMTARVQSMHEIVVQLVTVTAGRIPYPTPGLDLDRPQNAKANEDISEVVAQKRNDLILLSEDLDERLHNYRNVIQLHRRAKDYLEDAVRLTEWADERVKALRRAKVDLGDANISVDDLQRLERDRDSLLNKLKNDKENEVVDLLTRIQLVLDASESMKIPSIDHDGLAEVSLQLQERFDRLQQILEEHGLDLDALRKQMEDGQSYVEQARSLLAFVHDTRHALPSLKQTCGFMTGQSEEQDNRRFEMLQQSLAHIKAEFKARQHQYHQLSARAKMTSKTDNKEEISAIQSDLETEWDLLKDEINELERFSDIVGQWYDRQRRLSMIEQEYLKGLHEEIAHLAHSGWTHADLDRIQTRINKANALLEDAGEGSYNKDDPLETANYSCARDRHLMLRKKLQTAMTNLNSLRSNASKAMAFTAFLSDIDKLSHQVQQQKEEINRRMTDVGNSKFASQHMKTIDRHFKDSQASNAASEKEYQQLTRRFEQLLQQKLKTLGPESSNPSIKEAVSQAKDNLKQLLDTLQLEKKQAMFIRKIFIHAKAANDLESWIDHCAHAISELPTDVCMHDEHELKAELDHLEQKMAEMQPTIQAFETMESRIFAAPKDGSPLDLCEISLDRTEIKTAVRERQADILKRWEELKRKHAHVRTLVQHSKQGVEIARKMKMILTHVGDLKDRVSAVRICRNTQLDDGLENRDLNMVLNCPLTSIPTEHRLASAKAELDILDRDIENNLQPFIQELDHMLNTMEGQPNEDMFGGQRTEITIAVRGLMDLMRTKRKAIAEAEKMEGFLTVMEELEVLLLALADVVGRASLENARVVDGQYSRTDLQALLIDLDTRFRYYEPKINELFDEAKEVAEKLMDDRRVVDCLRQLTDRWIQLQQEAEAKKADLMQRIGPLADTFDTLDIGEGLLKERGRKAAASLLRKQSAPVLKQGPTPKSMQSTPRTLYNQQQRNTRTTTTPMPFALSATAARANARKNTGTSAIPATKKTTRQIPVRQTTGLQQQQRQRSLTKTPEAYVADPENDLDVALGDIVNDSPYKVLVKMVPGEVGKYWFGNENPRLAYCRILRSRMVMVRVGGGWVELSQFLSDHALLEGNFVSGRISRASLPSTPGGVIQDGFLNTTVGRAPPNRLTSQTGIVTVRGGGGGGQNNEANSPTLRESRSTPYRRGISPGPYGYGIKTGDKFLVTVDHDGNQVEVKMTKAKSKDMKFTTPRRNL